MRFMILLCLTLASFTARAGGIGVPGWEAMAKASQARAETRMRAHNEKLKAAWGVTAMGGFAPDAMLDTRITPNEGVELLYRVSRDAYALPGCAPMKGAMLFVGDVFSGPNAIILCAGGQVIRTFGDGRMPQLMKPAEFGMYAAALFGAK